MSGHFLWLAVTSCCYQHVLFSCSSDESLDCTDIPGQCLSVLMIKCINFVAAGCHSSHSGSFKWEAFKQLSNLKSSSHTSASLALSAFLAGWGEKGSMTLQQPLPLTSLLSTSALTRWVPLAEELYPHRSLHLPGP